MPSDDARLPPEDIGAAEAAFSEYVSRCGRGEEMEFEAFCAERPELADGLGKLYQQRELLQDHQERAQPALPETDAGLPAEDDRTPGSDSPSSEILQQLSEHVPAKSRYQLRGEVARGGMGAILKVWDVDLRRDLAMKVVLGKHEQGRTPAVDEHTLSRFLDEALVTGQLDHPGVVPVHELGVDSTGRVYFTMRLVKGRDLKAIFDLVKSGAEGWNQTRALGVLLKACEALSYAHLKGVVHRDLKPANIMVGRYGEVYVMDWGLAKVRGRKDTRDLRLKPPASSSLKSLVTLRKDTPAEPTGSPLLTMDGAVVGTPSFMSPEQARGEVEQVDERSDVYALGAVLYQLLTGEMPFLPSGERRSAHTILAALLEGPPRPVHHLAQAPAELEAICEKAMARDRERRYADVAELADDLRAFLENRVVGAYKTGALAELKKWVVRNKPLAAALAAGLLLLVGGLTTSLVFKARSDRNAQLAEEQQQLAQTQERVATQKADDVLSLSAIQELKELAERADALWPAEPDKLPDFEHWLGQAQLLIEGSPADPAHGIAAHPSLKDHEAKLAELRQRAQPLTPGQIEQDRRAGPSFPEWEQARAKLTWTRRMLGELPWPSEADVEAALAQETLPADANGLNGLAWPLVDPDPGKLVFGSEIRALILARRAVAAAADSERAGIRDTLGWALYRCGRAAEALAEEQRAVDEAPDGQKQGLAASLKQMQGLVALWAQGEPRSQQAEEARELSARVAELEREVNARRTFEFESAQDRWWHAQLSGLVADLKAFTDEQTGLFSAGISEPYGWGIGKRAEFARTIEERSVTGAEAQERWSAAIGAIRTSPKYAGLVLTPQLGLLPIGVDPDSGLWEFWHVQSGAEPLRGADGKLVLSEEMGVVLVLIPGGTFWMGAQKTDAAGHNYDPQAQPDESPVHEVTLSAYFLSKYELTQGQWERFTDRNPSSYTAGAMYGNHPTTLLHPVEQVSWDAAMEVLPRLGLELPTEAQWERGARGSTDTPWSTGLERETLVGAVNLADRAAAAGGATWQAIKDWPELDDGWVVHAAVGSFRANAFGLHDVHGNVWEWCRDGYDGGFYARRSEKDPFREPSGARRRVNRGGSFDNATSIARSANRNDSTPEFRVNILGLRPGKGITP